MNYRSHIPQTLKLNYVRNEKQRINERCSNITLQNKHKSYFDNTLRLNDYPETIIQWTNSKPKRRKSKDNQHERKNDDFIYFPFPFISDKVDKQIRRIFHQEKIAVRLTRKNKTLRNVLKQSPHQHQCNLRNCPMTDKTMCNRQSVVYKITCNICNKFYLGALSDHYTSVFVNILSTHLHLSTNIHNHAIIKAHFLI